MTGERHPGGEPPAVRGRSSGGLSVHEQITAEVAHIAASSAGVEDRAGALLGPLGRLTNYDAAWIAVRDPESRMHTALAIDGQVDPLIAYFANPEADDELEELGLNRYRGLVRARDLPVPLADIRAWADYLLPAGFRDGFAMALFTPDGRHVGFLSMLNGADTQFAVDACELLDALNPLLATAVDRLPSLAVAAGLIGDAVAGTVLTRASCATPLPGLPDHPLLVAGSPVLIAAQRLLTGASTFSFLCPDPQSAHSHLRVTVLDCRRPLQDHLRAVVLLSPAGHLYGLTRIELTILGLLIAGWSERRIEADVLTSRHTVDECVEQIQHKLRAPTRSRAVVQAARDGLYLPADLRTQT
jgi:DNA-binding CsgD family transcriptional regulator